MALLTGIFPSCEPADIEKALSSVPGVDLTTVRVLTKTAQSEAMDASPLDFVGVWEAQVDNSLSDDMTHSTGIMSSTGTSVPGLGGRNAQLSEFESHGGKKNYLANSGVPRDAIDNYNEAIEDNRCVVLIQSSDESVPDAMRAAGFKNVRKY